MPPHYFCVGEFAPTAPHSGAYVQWLGIYI